MSVSVRVVALVVALAVAACASLGRDEGTASVSGQATYPPDSALPPNSLLRVQLLDVSRQDTRAVLISETTIPLEGKHPPIEFHLAYRREAIKPSHTYSIRATIVVGDRVLYTTMRSYPVLTRSAPTDISVRLQSARP